MLPSSWLRQSGEHSFRRGVVATPDKQDPFAVCSPCGGDVTAPSGWVLVVDDDAADRMALFRLLERAGHHGTVADGGQAALELLRAETFDLVLLDLLMPGPDGFAVLEAMKGDRWLPAVPVIAITALDDPGSV